MNLRETDINFINFEPEIHELKLMTIFMAC